MNEQLLWANLLVAAVSAALALFSLLRARSGFDSFGKEVRDELRGSREEARSSAREFREEVSGNLKNTTGTIVTTLEAVAKPQQAQLDQMARQLHELTESNQTALDRIRAALDDRVRTLQEGNEKMLGEIRRENTDSFRAIRDSLGLSMQDMAQTMKLQLEGMTGRLEALTTSNQEALGQVRTAIDVRLTELREGNERVLGEIRRENSEALKTLSESVQTQLNTIAGQLKELQTANQGSLDQVRTVLDTRVKELQEGNERKLDEMRKTVDEKLHDTLEKRLGESFKIVSDRLEAVHKGLGEMQSLATGVGDLKRVLTNVKARGTWAEVQLGALLEQVLTTDQFDRNVAVKPESGERVEYAIRLPGAKDVPGSHVWLPIDSKFPQEDYIRLQDAADRADPTAVQAATEALARRIRSEAKDINDKYVNPPNTTDFAIMFLATEGLYAEVLRQPALVDELQQRYRVVVAGPTTLIAVLSSLRMGFQTLVIEQRASEVWRVLGAVKTEFGKFGTVLDKVKKQLSAASKTIDQTGVRTRALERQLRAVEQLPTADAEGVLALPALLPALDEDDLDDAESDSETDVVATE